LDELCIMITSSDGKYKPRQGFVGPSLKPQGQLHTMLVSMLQYNAGAVNRSDSVSRDLSSGVESHTAQHGPTMMRFSSHF
jgi:hypothetical protein